MHENLYNHFCMDSFDIDSALYLGQEQQPEGFSSVASLCGACSDIH
jgi:hypothetical protein